MLCTQSSYALIFPYQYPSHIILIRRVGELLQRGRYKSGPVPKVFKILPSHDQWARYLALTSPQNWSPQATLAATKIFVSNLKPEQTRVFLEGVVLPNVREDIKDNFGKLNVHLYDALKKGLYKPAAFFKGILFPLCKVCPHPPSHAAFLIWLVAGWLYVKGGVHRWIGALSCSCSRATFCGRITSSGNDGIYWYGCTPVSYINSQVNNHPTSGPNSLFIRVLLDKKYALPYQVVDGLWSHFVRLANTHKGSKAKGLSDDKLPVLWHQSLLVFCQR